MVEIAYSPNRGDIVWISLDPTLGRELKNVKPLPLQKGDRKRGAFSFMALHLNRSVMTLDNSLHNGQSQSRTAGLLRSRGVYSIKAIEQLRERTLWNADSRIDHFHEPNQLGTTFLRL